MSIFSATRSNRPVDLHATHLEFGRVYKRGLFEIVQNHYFLAVVFTSMSETDVPNSVRVRCGEGSNEWRYDAIQRASSFYERNRSDSIAYACNDVPRLIHRCKEILARDDLTLEQREEMAETMNKAVKGVTFEVETDVSIERD